MLNIHVCSGERSRLSNGTKLIKAYVQLHFNCCSDRVIYYAQYLTWEFCEHWTTSISINVDLLLSSCSILQLALLLEWLGKRNTLTGPSAERPNFSPRWYFAVCLLVTHCTNCFVHNDIQVTSCIRCIWKKMHDFTWFTCYLLLTATARDLSVQTQTC